MAARNHIIDEEDALPRHVGGYESTSQISGTVGGSELRLSFCGTTAAKGKLSAR